MTFEVNHGATVVKVTLYGDVTPEREEQERRAAQHRAQQLAPAAPRVNTRDRYIPYNRD